MTPFVIAGTVAAPSAHAATAPITEFSIPTSGSTPTSIADGPDGNLWFTESAANNIGKITTGGVVTEFPIPTAASAPTGIAAGPDGNLWFTENSGNNIGRITPSGTITEFAIPTSASGATTMVAGPDGNVWFAEHAAYQIGRITPAGVITEFQAGAPPVGITTGSDGNLWFTAYGCPNSITTAGVVTNFCASGANAGGPIITGRDGNLWFLAYQSVGTMTTAATGVNGFTTPYELDIANGPNSALWLANPSGFVDEMSPSGMLTEFAIPTASGSPAGITMGSDGNMWFTESAGNVIGRLQVPATCANETVSAQYATTAPGVSQTVVLQVMNCGTGPLANMTTQTTTTPPTGCGSAPAITEATAAPLGAGTATAAVSTTFPGPSCFGTYTITSQVLDGSSVVSSGPTSATYDDAVGGSAGFPNPGAASYARPLFITSGSDGNLWFSESGPAHDIARMTPTGVSTQFATPGASPGAVATGPDGNIWFSDNFSSSIGAMDTNGHLVLELPLPSGTFLQRLTGGPDGNVWFTARTSSGGAIGRITPAGKLKLFNVLTSAPTGITAGPDSNVWFTLNGEIGRITPQGAVTLFSSGGVTNPGSIALGPDGNLWFTSNFSSPSQIGRISTNGVVTLFPTPTVNSRPAVITPGADGNVWFTEVGISANSESQVGRITPAGVITEFPIANSDSSNAQFGFTAGPDGNLWAAAYYGLVIGQIGIAPPSACTAIATTTNPASVPGGSNETLTTTITNCASTPTRLKVVAKTTPPSGCGTTTQTAVSVPLAPRVGTTEVASFTAPACPGLYKVKSTLSNGTTVVGSTTVTFQVT